jgi:hypothetical protein
MPVASVDLLSPGRASREEDQDVRESGCRARLSGTKRSIATGPLWIIGGVQPIRGWTLTTLREKLIKISAKVVRHAKYVLFQMAEVAVPGKLSARILKRIARLWPACASVRHPG